MDNEQLINFIRRFGPPSAGSPETTPNLLTICTGSALAARAGLLDGRCCHSARWKLSRAYSSVKSVQKGVSCPFKTGRLGQWLQDQGIKTLLYRRATVWSYGWHRALTNPVLDTWSCCKHP